MELNLVKLRETWREKGFSDREISDYIGLDKKTLSKKFNGTLKPSLTATQFAIILDVIQSPMDMFITKGE